MRITLEEWLVQNGYSNADEALADYSELDDTYPAICSEDCHVEPDGHCPHGAPSLKSPKCQFLYLPISAKQIRALEIVSLANAGRLRYLFGESKTLPSPPRGG